MHLKTHLSSFISHVFMRCLFSLFFPFLTHLAGMEELFFIAPNLHTLCAWLWMLANKSIHICGTVLWTHYELSNALQLRRDSFFFPFRIFHPEKQIFRYSFIFVCLLVCLYVYPSHVPVYAYAQAYSECILYAWLPRFTIFKINFTGIRINIACLKIFLHM